MNPNLKWKIISIVFVILFSIYLLIGYPTFPTSIAQIKDNFGHQIRLGLDLQGGTLAVAAVLDLGVVAVVRGRGPGVGLAGLVDGPAQHRRSLPR